MKKQIILIATLALIIGGVACKKKYTTENITTKLETPHYPTITLSGDQYYSIPIGGTVPTISATAYDSVKNEVCAVTQIAGALDNTKPGLYPVSLSARNTDGYFSKINAFVAVTNVPANFDLSGGYRRTAGAMGLATVSKIKTGLYYSDNIFGVNPVTQAGSMAGFYFVHVNDSTIIIPDQQIDFGYFEPFNVSFTMLPGDTAYYYSINQPITSVPAIRKFVKE